MGNNIEIILTDKERKCGNCKDWFGKREVSLLRGTAIFSDTQFGMCLNSCAYGRSKKYSDNCPCHRRLNTDIDWYNEMINALDE